MKFRKYKIQDWENKHYGFCFELDKKQPTLDVFIGRTILVWFWERRR